MPAPRKAPAAKAPAEPAKPPGAAVHAKLLAIQTTIEQVAKTGTHAQGYAYIQEHKVIELLRPLLRENRCTVVVSAAEEFEVDPAVEYGRNKNRNALTTLVGVLTFTDVDSGEQITGRYVGQGIDDGDKGSGKAQTYLTKYALQKFFLIPTEGIDDADAGDIQAERQAEAVVEGRAPAPSPPAPAPGQGDAEIGMEQAGVIVEAMAGYVAQGKLDPNKVRAKLATYRTDDVAALTVSQADDFRTWLNAEVGA